MPNPDALENILSSEAVEEARDAAEQFGGRDEDRLRRARNAFEE
jgi:hypothetical protein